jgi:competence protein ComEA
MAQYPNQIFLTLLTLSVLGLTIRELDYQQQSMSIKPGVTVYVSGEVHRPGAISLPASARRMHAVTAAGGVTSRADLKELEPAKLLTDGETIWVAPKCRQPTIANSGGMGSDVDDRRVKLGHRPTQEKVALNKATEEQLQELPGIGPVLARRIVESRNSQPSGTFATIEDLATIRGIKRKTMARLTPFLELEAYDR